MRVNVLMIGDVVGESGLQAIEERLPGLIKAHEAALVVVNVENAADGFGMTAETLARILAAGADVVTSGNHIWEKRDFWPLMDSESRMLRPANYPPGQAGHGSIRIEKNGASFIVINLQGREFMTPIDCPFRCFDRIFEEELTTNNSDNAENSVKKPESENAGNNSDNANNSIKGPVALVDVHAESAAEKEALAYYLDGRAAVVAGTHTHVQTADERVLPQGTAYITDLGMTAPPDSCLGMDNKICIDRSLNQIAYRMTCATGQAVIQGIAATIDTETGRAATIQRIARG
jgi:calcineurin-like phosphoesterase